MHNLFSGKNRKNITNLSPESGKGYKPTFQIDSLTALDVFFFFFNQKVLELSCHFELYIW